VGERLDERTWRTRGDLAYRKLVDGGMIYDRERRQVHHLNRTAACVWEACQQGRSTRGIVEELCRLFSVEHSDARRDVEEILEQFVEADLIQR